MTKEIWKDYTGSIKEFHGLIRVSNMGRIYKRGTNTSKNNSGILKCTKSKYGYVKMHVSVNGQDFNQPVHRLVAETFILNPKNKPYVDHINAKRDDNRASNLRWVTTAENNRNPIYLKKLSENTKKRMLDGNWLVKSLYKPVYIENKDGVKIYFKSIKDVRAYFHTNANVRRFLKSGRFVKSRKSKLRGWRVRYVDPKGH